MLTQDVDMACYLSLFMKDKYLSRQATPLTNKVIRRIESVSQLLDSRESSLKRKFLTKRFLRQLAQEKVLDRKILEKVSVSQLGILFLIKFAQPDVPDNACRPDA